MAFISSNTPFSKRERTFLPRSGLQTVRSIGQRLEPFRSCTDSGPPLYRFPGNNPNRILNPSIELRRFPRRPDVSLRMQPGVTHQLGRYRELAIDENESLREVKSVLHRTAYTTAPERAA